MPGPIATLLAKGLKKVPQGVDSFHRSSTRRSIRGH